MIDNTELSPFASSRVRANSRHYSAMMTSSSSSSSDKKKQKKSSSYSSLSPISMQKTFVLPQSVTCLQQTITERGITNKHLLISLQNGQIFSVDLRQIHPRRPLTEPSPAGHLVSCFVPSPLVKSQIIIIMLNMIMTEKVEGLQRYSPFLVFHPYEAVTHNYSLPGGVSNILSTSSLLESSTLVLSFGGRSVDVQLNRLMPSLEFDLLASDFNYNLLLLTLLVLASAVLVLRRIQNSKQLSLLWS